MKHYSIPVAFYPPTPAILPYLEPRNPHRQTPEALRDRIQRLEELVELLAVRAGFDLQAWERAAADEREEVAYEDAVHRLRRRSR